MERSATRPWANVVPMMLGFNAAIAALITLLFLALADRVTPKALAWQFLAALNYSNCIGIPAALVLGYLGPWLARRRHAVKWPVMLGTLVVIALAGTLVAIGIRFAITSTPWHLFWKEYYGSVRFACLITVVIGVGSFFYETLQYRLERATLELRTRELERERALKLATEARLASLESRVHPHFLFNALNSISSLIQDDPKRAERLLERMAALLRFSLDAHQAGLVSLGQEMKIVADYLEIEKSRFGERLQYAMDIPDEMGGRRVPPLAVQTLVENSVKYAVAPRREGGRIRVSARQSGGNLEVEVADDGPGFEPEVIVPGHGLDNLRARLAALFGPAELLEIRNGGPGVAVCVSVPQGQVDAARVSAG